MKNIIGILYITFLVKIADGSSFSTERPNPALCLTCKTNPCSLVKKTCQPGFSLKPDWCRCKCECEGCFVCLAVLCRPDTCPAGQTCVQASCGCSYSCVKSCDRPCPRIFRPVCGTDGKTYGDQCLLNVAICKSRGKLRKKHNGRCSCDRPCPRIFRPVCGTDGKTYGNQCLLNVAICRSGGKLRKKHNGICNKFCPYHNPCFGIRCGKGKKCVPNFRECAYSCQPKVCPQLNCIQPACDAKPCAKDQKCLSICKNSCVHACEIKRGCDRPCPKIWRPVCGSDGKTYGNQCLLNVAICKSGEKLSKKHNGKCKCGKNLCEPFKGKCNTIIGEFCEVNEKQCTARCVCPSNCPTDEYQPVCGTDGVTYTNPCELSIKTCSTGGKVTKMFDNSCEVCKNKCSLIYCMPNYRCVNLPDKCSAQCISN